MRKTFPFHGFVGIVLLLASELLHLRKVEPFYSWFYCFAWWSYILMVDGIIHRIKGNSLISNRPKEFLLMIPWSVVIWLIFEAANLSLRNWYYVNIPHSFAERWLGYAVAYGTVLPGLFETTELLESLGLFKTSRTWKISFSPWGHLCLVLLGAVSLLLSLFVPLYFFPLIWVGFIFLLEPFNYRLGGRSLLKDLEEGNPREIYLLLAAGLICGLLWEFWNYWARSKWVYTVPFFEEMKGFEMPYLGFLGFPPFAIQAYVMYNAVSLFRFRRGWEQSSYRLNLKSKTRPLTALLTAFLIISFSVLVFRAIDAHTVDSYLPRLSDAYWIPPQYRHELPNVGITSLDDLISKTRDRKDMEELALRLLVYRGEVLSWVERARLAKLKGLGIKNLRLLDGLEIHSLRTLSEQSPEKLEGRMRETYQGRPIPGLSKLKIWVREAEKEVNRDE